MTIRVVLGSELGGTGRHNLSGEPPGLDRQSMNAYQSRPGTRTAIAWDAKEGSAIDLLSNLRRKRGKKNNYECTGRCYKSDKACEARCSKAALTLGCSSERPEKCRVRQDIFFYF
ncbi:hypothetical protein RRG08_034087 [Elysia crispata]|uniref:Uncharacterized protein n=1 Tax=Elysia crispata TaxID=231223 RepID=A0AAE0YUD2_9GAST|nr:hypothetical protein RRG08_034087 [Elysia crispata]